MATKVQLTGGAFQDSTGAVLANGYLKMKLNQDCMVNSSQVCAGVEITIQLDSAGNVASSTSTPAATNQLVWGNDQLSPTNSFYRVTGYKANGQIAFGPNNQQVIGNGGTFNVGTWVPNQVVDWTGAVQQIEIQVNGVDANSQKLLNFKDTATVTWTDAGNGDIEATAAGGGGTGLQVDLTIHDFHLSVAGGVKTFTITLSQDGLYSISVGWLLHNAVDGAGGTYHVSDSYTNIFGTPAANFNGDLGVSAGGGSVPFVGYAFMQTGTWVITFDPTNLSTDEADVRLLFGAVRLSAGTP